VNNKYIYDYLDKLTTAIEKKQEKLRDELDKKLLKEISYLQKDIEKLEKGKEIDAMSLYRILEKAEWYTIKDDNWHFKGKDLGIKAVGKDGYNPVKGRDYRDGVDGKDFKYEDFTKQQLIALRGQDGYTPVKGKDYRDGKDGKDGYTPVKGKDYFDGKDAIIPNLKIGDVRTIQPGGDASVEIRETEDGLILDFNIPRGVTGGKGAVGDTGLPGTNGTNGTNGEKGDPGIVIDEGAEGTFDTVWAGSRAEYDLLTPVETTLYLIKE
jgi:hypothetical protein